MNRKRFLNSVLTLGVLPGLHFDELELADEPEKITTPRYLRNGDIIGITAPAGHIEPEEIQPAIIQMESWGYKTKVGNTIGKKISLLGEQMQNERVISRRC